MLIDAELRGKMMKMGNEGGDKMWANTGTLYSSTVAKPLPTGDLTSYTK